MADIFHCLRMSASPDDVFRAVTEDELLRPWWASEERPGMSAVSTSRRHAASRGAASTARPSGSARTSCSRSRARAARRSFASRTGTGARRTTRSRSCTTKWGRVLMALKSRVETPEADDLV